MPLKKLRPGGRTELNRLAVASAVLAYIKEGNSDFSVQDVADRSGVHRTTITRRWPDRTALIAEATAEHVSRISVKLTGDWKKDLKNTARFLRDFFNDPVELAMNRAAASSTNPILYEQLGKHWTPILSELKTPLRIAQQNGMIRPDADIDVAMDMLMYTLLGLSLYSPDPTTNETVDKIIAHLLLSEE